MFLEISKKDRTKIQYEVISRETRLKITRLIRYQCKDPESDIELISTNRFINIARQVENLPVYVLKADYWANYLPAEHAWHNGELELIIMRPDTCKLVEILADFLQIGLLDIGDINSIFQNDGVGIQFISSGFNPQIDIEVLEIDDIDHENLSNEHPNIRKLINRMDNEFNNDDFSAVLHASASIFETLAKDIISDSSIENHSLGSFFNKYKKESKLPEPLLDYILSTFKKRNTEPLAGHGSTIVPKINREEAIILIEMTKSLVIIERKLAILELHLNSEKKG